MSTPFTASSNSCSQGKPCVFWVQKIFNDCLCDVSDEISFVFGLISLICWGVAEVPQIITNFINKSSHGVSLAFLMTWIVGDIFNLVGCLWEPVTLPTQFYTALLYTISTVILVLQTLYYDYFCRWWKCRGTEVESMVEDTTEPLKAKVFGSVQNTIPIDDTKKHTKHKKDGSSLPIPANSPQLRHKKSPHNELYYLSARSLTSSQTPPHGSYLGIARSGPSTMALDDESSEDETFPSTNTKSSSRPIRVPRSVGYGTLILTGLNLSSQSKALVLGHKRMSGRKLLQEHGMESNVYGIWLGWMMAAIYMGGRIPQIYLNIKRGSVEGLNPLMFIFALVANATYVGSILVRSTEWKMIHANMPWLLDAIVCVALDLFIVLQFIYYRYMQSSDNLEDNCGEYTEVKKG